MKLLAPAGVLLASVLMAFPMLFAGGDGPSLEQAGCVPPAATSPALTEMTAILATIRQRESGGDYQARAPGSTASGAYQFIDGTWARYGGYARAWLAPPDVQDAKATEHARGILDANNGDVTVVPVVWYIGYLPTPGDRTWDVVPGAGAGNRLTPREYQTAWIEAYTRHVVSEPSVPTTISASTTPGGQQAGPAGDCAGVVPGSDQGTVLDGGWAYPASITLFSSAPVANPHHDYPAWDWSIPEGTAIFAVRGGEVVSVSTWADNTLDHPCSASQNCSPCGVGVTIADDAGTQWTYCHGSQLHVNVGQNVAAGSQILSSGNTGRSTGPHLHLAIRTSGRQRRCPQPLLAALRDRGTGLDPADLPTSGCSY